MIGLEWGAIRVVPYCGEWPRLYEEEAKHVRQAIGERIRDIQHFGSTAVPGMCAKPIIDIAVAVDSLNAAQICIKQLEKIGYKHLWASDQPRSDFFIKGNPTEYHLRIFEAGSPDWARHIGFRDLLRRDSRVASDYAKLKKDLSKRFKNSREAYQDGKTDFVQNILDHAGTEQAALAEE